MKCRAEALLLLTFCLVLSMGVFRCASDTPTEGKEAPAPGLTRPEKLERSDAEWRSLLTPMQYRVLREGETEPPYSGLYVKGQSPGLYVCRGCGQPLFDSEAQLDSDTGWATFDAPASETCIAARLDRSFGVAREAVYCSRCDGHLGHVFHDVTPPFGARYCINSGAILFTGYAELETKP